MTAVSAVDNGVMVGTARPAVAGLDSRIRKVALLTFLQIGFAIALNMTISQFYVVPVTLTVLTAGLIGSLIAWGYRCYRMKTSKDVDEHSVRAFEESGASYSTVPQHSLATVISDGGPGIFVHESGHALAALACYKGVKPKITIIPFVGGRTTIDVCQGLTRLGKLLGERGAKLAFTVGGASMSLMASLGGLTMARAIKDKHPNISDMFFMTSVCQVAREALYALSAYFVVGAPPSHDFIRLWMMTGISPLTATLFIVAVPLVHYFAMRRLFP